jgi:hypothetical protein
MAYCRYRATPEVNLLHLFSTLTLDRVEWSASNPYGFTLAEGALGFTDQEAIWAPGLVMQEIMRHCIECG